MSKRTILLLLSGCCLALGAGKELKPIPKDCFVLLEAIAIPSPSLEAQFLSWYERAVIDPKGSIQSMDDRWVGLPLWTLRVRHVLDLVSDLESDNPPSSIVHWRYNAFFLHQLTLKFSDPDWDDEELCEAINDAAIYSLNNNQRGVADHALVVKYNQFARIVECSMSKFIRERDNWWLGIW